MPRGSIQVNTNKREAENWGSEEKVTDRKPPPWGGDPLSAFFEDAEYNDRVTALRFPAVYALLQRLHADFRRVEEAIRYVGRQELLVTQFLMVRTHSSFLGAIRLAMSGQLSESYVILRVAIEQAWYALHIAMDPRPPERVTVWLRRNEDEASKDKCRKEFTVARVRSTHESTDSETAKKLQNLYDLMIDFGAHPNQLGLMASLSKSETDDEVNFKVGILFPDDASVFSTLRMAVEVAIGGLNVFQLILPERFKLLQLDTEIDSLVPEMNRVFRSFARQR